MRKTVNTEHLAGAADALLHATVELGVAGTGPLARTTDHLLGELMDVLAAEPTRQELAGRFAVVCEALADTLAISAVDPLFPPAAVAHLRTAWDRLMQV